jgi:hypothetical protein
MCVPLDLYILYYFLAWWVGVGTNLPSQMGSCVGPRSAVQQLMKEQIFIVVHKALRYEHGRRAKFLGDSR